MKFIEAIRTHAHVRCQAVWGEGVGRIFQLHGEKFYNMGDEMYGLFNTELLQLGRYALEVQPPKITNNMVLRNATLPEKRHETQTSGVFHFSPEKTRGAVERPPQLLGQGGFNPFLMPPTPFPTLTYTNDKARTDHSGQLPICSPLTQPGQSSRLAGRAVAGSNPAGAFCTCSSNGRAPHLQSRGFGSESQRAHSKITVMQGAKP